jgi:hypothetical protein
VIYHTGDPTFFRGDKPASCVVVDSETGDSVRHLVFANNIVQGCSTLISLWQFHVDSEYEDLRFYNNTLLRPFGDGRVLFSDMKKLEGFSFVNNLTYAPDATASMFAKADDVAFHHNIWSVAPPAGLTGQGDIVTARPGIVELNHAPAPGCLDVETIRLEANAAARTQGVRVDAVATDFFGRSRSGTTGIGASLD